MSALPTGPVGQCLARVATGALVTSYAGVALYGSLYTNVSILLLVAPVLGAVGAVGARSVHRSLYRERAVPWTRFLPAATACALFVPFARGVQHLGDIGGYVVLVIVGLFTVRAAVWAHTTELPADASLPAAEPSRPALRPPESPDQSSCQELLQTLSLDDLIAEWCSSSRQLHPSSDRPRHTAVRWRETLLEELQRRDPRGFDNWLLDGMRRGPEHHLAADPDDLPGDGPDALPTR